MTKLAIKGGKPIRDNLLPLSKPVLDNAEITAVTNTINSGWIAQGPKVREFEDKFAAYTGVKHAIAVSSGTTALHLAVIALNLNPGEFVICPSFTFVATANAILYEGAKPIFGDIDSQTYNLDSNAVDQHVWKKAVGIILVHYAGYPADLNAFAAKAEQHDLFLIEDAAEAHGCVYQGKKAGSLGNIGVFSFYPTKNITTGEGGIMTTDDDAVAERCLSLRNHGRMGSQGFLHGEMGYNYRMTDIQGAIGACQIDKLDNIIASKRQIADELTCKLSGIEGIATPFEDNGCLHTYQLYTIRIDQNVFGCTRDYLVKALRAEGIASNVYYDPVHLQPYFSEMGYRKGINPVAETCGETVLSLPIFSEMQLSDINDIGDALGKITGLSANV